MQNMRSLDEIYFSVFLKRLFVVTYPHGNSASLEEPLGVAEIDRKEHLDEDCHKRGLNQSRPRGDKQAKLDFALDEQRHLLEIS